MKETFFRAKRAVLPTGIKPASVKVVAGKIAAVAAYEAVPEGARPWTVCVTWLAVWNRHGGPPVRKRVLRLCAAGCFSL